MEPLKQRRGHGPEKKIQKAIINMLRIKGWYVKETHGNAFQDGFPDLFACHYNYGQRWIEVKRPKMKGSRFTPAQLRDFPQFCAHGSGVWVLTGDTEEEYNKLFKGPNWSVYLEIMK